MAATKHLLVAAGKRVGSRVRRVLRAIWAWFCREAKDGSIARCAAVAMMLLLVALPMVVVLLTVWGGVHAETRPDEVSTAALKMAAVLVLAFMPGWLYVRFLGQRAGALWNEYVLNLHRLAWDEPGFLPEPPCSSAFHREWLDARQDWCPNEADESNRVNIYQQKFDAYYGRAVSAAKPQHDFMVHPGMMFPVFLATAVLAIGWTAVLWDQTSASAPTNVWDALKFAFVGAYIFSIQSLLRRFFQSDLRASAYASVLVRFAVALSVTVALLQMLHFPAGTEAAIAFVVGIFPAVALQALKRSCQALLGVVVPTSLPDYPLNQIDGLDLWYEDRLMEEGIEDMQNLATANLVDVMLHCRVPVDRLVDWVDQAHLYLHLDHAETGRSERKKVDKQLGDERGAGGQGLSERLAAETTVQLAAVGSDTGPVTLSEADAMAAKQAVTRVHGSSSLQSRAGTRTRIALRQLGIRTATDLLNVFPDERSLDEAKDLASGIDEFQVRLLRRALLAEDGLTAVRNWQQRGVQARVDGAGPTPPEAPRKPEAEAEPRSSEREAA